MESYEKDRTPVCSNKLELHSRMTSVGRPMSEGRPIEEGLHKPRLWIDPKELTGYLKEEIDRFDFGKKDDKCHILDSILDTFPENLKAYAEDICNTLKCRNDVLINHNWEVSVHGYTIRGSNIYTMIVNELTRRGEKFA